MKRIAILFFIWMASLNAGATWLDSEDIRKDLKATDYRTSNLQESEFRTLLKTLQDTYAPFATKHGGKLSISGDWKNETPNAGATQMFGNWQVKMTGGLARRAELTPDGFALIVCHELGHHFGGFVIGPSQNPFEKAWAANEGQADYFSTQVCARKIWVEDTAANAEFRKTASSKIQALCDAVWESTDEQNLCYRTLTAVESMTTTMATLMNKPAPHFDTPDSSVVEKTSHAHPAVQCRMDTTTQAALCRAIFDPLIIPGKTAAGGVEGIEAEREASSFSCTHYSSFSTGLRPTCWFKARL